MKNFLFLAAIAAVVGSIYHTEIGDYFADFSAGSSDGGGSVIGSMRDMGESGNSMMNRLGQ